MSQPTQQPNILFVFSDQQRASAMGFYYGDEDLENDPYEQNNLVDENASIVSELDGLLLDAMKKTGDSWRDVGRESGDWQEWHGNKQIGQLELGAEYPGSEAIRSWAERNKLVYGLDPV